MATQDPSDERIALLQGTLDLLILRTLIFGRQHGQGIARAIRQQSEDVLLVDHGTLYPALQRLEEKGWIDSRHLNEQPSCALFTSSPGRAAAINAQDQSMAEAGRREASIGA
jgi:DNA-binding HxlR family transcriptional regulator